MSVSKDLALSFVELHREISKCVIKASRLSCLPEVPVLVQRHGKGDGTKTRLLENYFSSHVYIVCLGYGAKVPRAIQSFEFFSSS
jgi:hypothetical protein